MNFQQLRIIRETLRRNYNLTEVASALATSQSGVSKHLKDIETELGVELFVRRGKRLLGLTEPGKEISCYVEQILIDTANIKRVAENLSKIEAGKLTIATTHTQARYTLPDIIVNFRHAFPNVRLVLNQTSPTEITRMLIEGRADIGIATEAISEHPDLIAFPYRSWRHVAVVPRNHELDQLKQIRLEDIAAHPLITYNASFAGRSAIDATFDASGLSPDIILEAMDADVIKTYVGLGLGVGIIASVAMESKASSDELVTVGDELFPITISYIALRKGRFMRGFAYRFIEACCADLTESAVKSASKK